MTDKPTKPPHYKIREPGTRLPFDRTPLIGTWISRLGRVWDIAATPCEISPTIWVLATWTALPTLLITPIKPSPTDYLIVRAGLHHGKRQRIRFDVWDIIHATGAGGPGVYWAEFKLGAWGARLLWYFAVADAISAFLVNWTSAAYQYAGCEFPGAPFARGHPITGPFPIGNLSNGVFDFWLRDDSSIFLMDSVQIATPAGFEPTVMWNLDWDHEGIPLADQANPTFYLEDIATMAIMGEIETPRSGRKYREPFTGTYTMVSAQQDFLDLVKHGANVHVYQVRYKSDKAGWINVKGGSFAAYGRPVKDAILPDP